MTEPVQIRLTPAVQSVVATIQPYVGWIEEIVGTSYGNTVTLEFFPNPSVCIAQDLLPGASTTLAEQDGGITWREHVTGWHLPPDISPRIRVSRCRKPQPGGLPLTSWAVEWQECPVAVTLRGVKHDIVVINVPANFPGDAMGHEFRSWFIAHREDASAVLATIGQVLSAAPKSIHGIQAPALLPVAYNWDSLVLSDSVTKLVRRDFELFFTREAWFREHGLPFRRGYLLYGPAGNGKTSVIRVMAAHPQIRAYALDLSGPDASGSEVWRVFRTAQRSASALVILEDLDRIFPRDGLRDAARQSMFQALLNNLDGVSMYSGLIVVGTANDPTALDASILRRPGRFDRVVAFPLPTPSCVIGIFPISILTVPTSRWPRPYRNQTAFRSRSCEKPTSLRDSTHLIVTTRLLAATC